MWDAAAMQDAASTNAKQARRPFPAVLCDLDGVLRVWDEDETAGLEAEYDLLPGTVAAVAFDPARLLPALRGPIGDEEWRTSVAAAFVPAQGIEAAADLVSRWSASIGRVDKAVLALVDATRRGGGPGLIPTNSTTRLGAGRRAGPHRDQFDPQTRVGPRGSRPGQCGRRRCQFGSNRGCEAEPGLLPRRRLAGGRAARTGALRRGDAG